MTSTVKARILDGKATAAAIRAEVAEAAAEFTARHGRAPGLATLLAGDDPGSSAYVRGKHKACAEVGIASVDRRLPADVTDADVLAEVAALNADPAVDAFIVQLPLPDGLDERAALEAVDPEKDADGLHPTNLGRLALGHPAVLPCTPAGILELLRRYEVPVAGAKVTIVGRGVTVGRPLGLLLSLKGIDATVTLCHSRTRDLAAETVEADIVVAATGRAGLLRPEMVKPGAAVLDIGITRTPDGLVGDVAPGVAEVAGWLAPMPGGVGPMTVALLLRNALEIARRREGT